MVQILIDADGCPVVDLSIALGKQYHVPVVLVADTSHRLERDGVTTIMVEKGDDSADFKLVNLISNGDIVITQDYGLAAMAQSRGALVLNQNGSQYTDENIDGLLMSRHIGKKLRRAGGRTKGPAKRSREQDLSFQRSLERLLKISLQDHR